MAEVPSSSGYRAGKTAPSQAVLCNSARPMSSGCRSAPQRWLPGTSPLAPHGDVGKTKERLSDPLRNLSPGWHLATSYFLSCFPSMLGPTAFWLSRVIPHSFGMISSDSSTSLRPSRFLHGGICGGGAGSLVTLSSLETGNANERGLQKQPFNNHVTLGQLPKIARLWIIAHNGTRFRGSSWASTALARGSCE